MVPELEPDRDRDIERSRVRLHSAIKQLGVHLASLTCATRQAGVLFIVFRGW